MILSTGRTVIEWRLPNGATFAGIGETGGELTPEEWTEYAQRIRALSTEEARARLAARRVDGCPWS